MFRYTFSSRQIIFAFHSFALFIFFFHWIYKQSTIVSKTFCWMFLLKCFCYFVFWLFYWLWSCLVFLWLFCWFLDFFYFYYVYFWVISWESFVFYILVSLGIVKLFYLFWVFKNFCWLERCFLLVLWETHWFACTFFWKFLICWKLFTLIYSWRY